MYELFTENKINSILPKHTTNAAQRIRKARSRFARIPRTDEKVPLLRFLLQIPQPYHRIKPKTQTSRPFRTFSFPTLRFLAAYKLLGILESVLDAPSACKTAYHLCESKTQICGKEKVVFLFACRVSTYYQKHRSVRNPVPYNFSGIYQTFSAFASFAGFYQLPVVYSFDHILRRRKPFAFFARPASSLFSSLAGKIVNKCIATHTRDYMCIGYIPSGQRGVKSVRMVDKLPLRQPQANFCQHFFGQFYQGQTVLSVQSHIDWQAKWFAAPGWVHSQGKNNQVQSPGVDCFCDGRKDGISPPSGPIDFSAAAMKQCVVQVGIHHCKILMQEGRKDVLE